MANALKGNSSVSIVWITPNEKATEALRIFIEGHMEFMKTKSYRDGPLKLIHYSISEGPEWNDQSRWHTGETPGTTGRRVFHLFEIYENLEGLQHHWMEAEEFQEEIYQIFEVYKIEIHQFNQMKIIQSLWE
jgi:hypothetical protein|tara:strand:- start:9 stop:404 length:396 start_codon:yes stop_codon:yes gene_type:complete